MSLSYNLAASLFNGDFVLGSDKSDIIDRITLTNDNAGLQLYFNISKHISPSNEILGCKILVIKRILGGTNGYSLQNLIDNLNLPF
jgi:hypothetical protein